MERRISLVIILAILLGLIVTRIDTRPHWDDTGITVLLLFFASVVCGYLIPRHPWLIALAVCTWIPLYNILVSRNYGSLLALLPGLAGAYTGFYLKKNLVKQGPK
jgi:hypothetical protein